MSTSEEFFAEKPKSTIMLCSNFGEGKTSVAITFPKIFYVGFRQGGLEVLRQPKNAHYKSNLIRYEDMVPKSDEDLKDIFNPSNRAGKIFKMIDEAKEMARKGEVETLILDDFTDCIENIQKYVWRWEPKKTDRGLDDNQSMYGVLKTRTSDLFDREILPFRKLGNLVVTTHLMREADQTIEGTATRAGAVDKKSDLYPDIIGSFRREVQRKFENVLYMECKLDASGGKKYVAYTTKQVAMGTTILAKNVLGLPPVVEDVTYQKLMASVNKG